jgi:hypothetical protein
MSDAVDRVVREARRSWGSGELRVNWKAVEHGLFARIEREQRAERESLAANTGRGWKALAFALAAAVALVLVARVQKGRPLEPEHASTDDEAANVVAIDGSGEVLIGGRRASAGTALHLGEVIETHGAQATVGRAP